MTYRLPSLKALRAFEAAARHRSFKHAGVELCVTAGAVSQQVKALEDSLGIALFRRLPQGVELTPEGESYLDSVSGAFHAISTATDKLGASLDGRKLRLGVEQTLSDAFKATATVQDTERETYVAVVCESHDLAPVLDGSLDALLRPRVTSHPKLHLDQFELVATNGARHEVTLAIMPGNAGCRHHRLLLEALNRADSV